MFQIIASFLKFPFTR